MTQGLAEFRLKLIRRLTKRAYSLTKPAIPSRTLRSSLFWKVETLSKAYLEVPHYWAVYYHQGVTNRIRPRRAKFLVWYTKTTDDPRLTRGRGPERAIDIKRLTRDQFQEGLRRNRLRRKRGLPPFMIVAKSRKGFTGVPFYTNALGQGKGLTLAHSVIKPDFSRYMRGFLNKKGVRAIGRVQEVKVRMKL